MDKSCPTNVSIWTNHARPTSPNGQIMPGQRLQMDKSCQWQRLHMDKSCRGQRLHMDKSCRGQRHHMDKSCQTNVIIWTNHARPTSSYGQIMPGQHHHMDKSCQAKVIIWTNHARHINTWTAAKRTSLFWTHYVRDNISIRTNHVRNSVSIRTNHVRHSVFIWTNHVRDDSVQKSSQGRQRA